MAVPPTFPVPTLTVRPWVDAVIDELGHDARSPYVEQFWLSILGPSSTWLLRRLVTGLEAAPEGYELDLAATAIELGLGNRSGRHSPFMRSIERCRRFGAVDLQDGTGLLVRRKLPPLTRVQIERLPPSLRSAHDAWQQRPTATPLAYDAIRQRARCLAASLVEDGEDGESTERWLHRWGVHPAVAHDATAWAIARHLDGLRATEVTVELAAGTDGPEAA